MTNEELLLHRADPAIRDQIIQHNTRLVKSIAVKFNPEDEDLVSEGMIGLIKAINKFDSTKNYKFSTYAYRYIHGAILDYYNRIECKIPHSHSLNERANDEDDHELIDLLVDKENLIDQYEDYESSNTRKKIIYCILDKECNEQDKEIFKMYLDGKTRRDIRTRFGISRERVRQVEYNVKAIINFYIKNVYDNI